MKPKRNEESAIKAPPGANLLTSPTINNKNIMAMGIPIIQKNKPIEFQNSGVKETREEYLFATHAKNEGRLGVPNCDSEGEGVCVLFCRADTALYNEFILYLISITSDLRFCN